MDTAVKRGYTMAEACDYLGGISRQTMYRLGLPSYHIGVRVYFTKEVLDKFIQREMYPEVEADLKGVTNEYLS